MKTLNEYIDESLLDDEEEIVNNNKPIINQLLNKMSSYKFPKSKSIKHDRMGKKIKIGDLVLFGDSGLVCAGIVTEFTVGERWMKVNTGTQEEHVICNDCMVISEKAFIEMFK